MLKGSLEQIDRYKCAFYNVPITLWIYGHEPDPELRRVQPTRYPIPLVWKHGHLSLTDHEFEYHRFFNLQTFATLLLNLNKKTSEIHGDLRGLVGLYEVEFAYYALLLAIIAILITVLFPLFIG